MINQWKKMRTDLAWLENGERSLPSERTVPQPLFEGMGCVTCHVLMALRGPEIAFRNYRVGAKSGCLFLWSQRSRKCLGSWLRSGIPWVAGIVKPWACFGLWFWGGVFSFLRCCFKNKRNNEMNSFFQKSLFWDYHSRETHQESMATGKHNT